MTDPRARHEPDATRAERRRRPTLGKADSTADQDAHGERTSRLGHVVKFPAPKPPPTHDSIIDTIDMDGVKVTRVIGDYRSGIRLRSYLWAKYYPKAAS
jgi:hypothetical protein